MPVRLVDNVFERLEGGRRLDDVLGDGSSGKRIAGGGKDADLRERIEGPAAVNATDVGMLRQSSVEDFC
jgi:hypothetical protein